MTTTADRFVSRLAEPIQERLRLQADVTDKSIAGVLAETLDNGLMPMDELARRQYERAAALMRKTGQVPAA